MGVNIRLNSFITEFATGYRAIHLKARQVLTTVMNITKSILKQMKKITEMTVIEDCFVCANPTFKKGCISQPRENLLRASRTINSIMNNHDS